MSSAPSLELFAAYEAFRVAGRHNALAAVGLVPGWTQDHMIYVMDSDNYKQLKAQLDASRAPAEGGRAGGGRAACGRRAGGRHADHTDHAGVRAGKQIRRRLWHRR